MKRIACSQPSKPNKRSKTQYLTHLDDIPEDCLRDILKLVLFETIPSQILSLLTVSKRFHTVCLCQDSALAREMVESAFDSELGKQLPRKPAKTGRSTWRFCVDCIFTFCSYQAAQSQFQGLINLSLDRSLEDFKEYDQIVFQVNSKMEEVQLATDPDEGGFHLFSKNSLCFDIGWLPHALYQSFTGITFEHNLIFGIPGKVFVFFLLLLFFFILFCSFSVLFSFFSFIFFSFYFLFSFFFSSLHLFILSLLLSFSFSFLPSFYFLSLFTFSR